MSDQSFESPEQTYVPRCKVRLGIRFEEFGDTGPLKSRVPKKPAKNAKGTSDARAELYAHEDTSVPFNASAPFSKRWVLMPRGGVPGEGKVGGPQDERSSSDDRTHFIEGIIPKDAQWTQNGVRAADTLKLTLKFIDCPVDPRAIRACAVSFYLGTITTEDHRTQLLGRQYGSGGEVLPDTYVDADGRQRTNNRFEGWVDTWDVDINDEGEPTATLECRDNTQVVIDQEAPPKLVCDAKIIFPEAVAKYLAHFPQFVGLSIEYRGVGVAPTLESVLAKGTYAPNLGPPPAGGGGASGGTGKLSVWDYLTDCARALGHLIFMEGTTIVITRARTLYSSSGAQRPDDPFTTRGGYNHRVFIFGRNVSKIGIKRSYNKQAPSNVEVRCFPGETRVTAREIERIYRRAYSGPMVRLETRDGRVLSGTPNHPVLTERGWVPMRELAHGDHLVCEDRWGERASGGDPHEECAPTELRELFDAATDAIGLVVCGLAPRERVRTSEVDFHGDGKDGDVDVVTIDRELWSRIDAALVKKREQLVLKTSGARARALDGDCARILSASDLSSRESTSACRVVHVSGETRAIFDAHTGEAKGFGFSVGASADAARVESRVDDAGVNADRIAECPDALSFEVPSDQIVSVETFEFSGHVYNLQTASNTYAAEGIVSHNCYLPAQKRLLVGRFPGRDDFLAMGLPGDGGTDAKWTVHNVSGFKSEAALIAIAKHIYESVGRNELSLKVSTKNLASLGGGNLDPDILDMRAGDPFELLVNRDPSGPSVNQIEQFLVVQERAAQFLRDLGFDDGFADAYAKAYGDSGFQTVFRTKTIGIKWGIDDGVAVDLEGMNYITVRADAVFGDDDGSADAASQA